MNRDFNKWFATFRSSIATYSYYTDFNKVFEHVDALKIELNILNSLIGSKNIVTDFINITSRYPETLKCIPLLIAVRQLEISATDEDGSFIYNFKIPNHNISQYVIFMQKTGLFDLLTNHIINNLVDYALGVEVGLDSNGRKNRGGTTMELLIENYIQRTYVKESYRQFGIKKIQDKWNIDLSSISNNGKSEKRFDFVVYANNTVFGIETNFYASGGSKLNETARSYKSISEATKSINGFEFIWFTDGKGWESARNNLQETFDVMDHIYNITDLENGIMNTIFGK